MLSYEHPAGWWRYSVLSILCPLLFAVTILLLTLASAAAQGNSDPVEIRQTTQEILSNARYQTELPDGPASPQPPTRTRRNLDIPNIAAPIRLIFSAVALVAVVAIVFYLAKDLPFVLRRRREQSDEVNAGSPSRASHRHQDPVDLADALARQGRYGEAMHMLLLHGLERLRRQLGIDLAPSWTSREILDQLSLREEARTALASLVRSVELDHFGGRVSGAADYQSCRDSYHHLAVAGSKP